MAAGAHKIALLIGEGAKCPNDSLGSLKSPFSLCVKGVFLMIFQGISLYDGGDINTFEINCWNENHFIIAGDINENSCWI